MLGSNQPVNRCCILTSYNVTCVNNRFTPQHYNSTKRSPEKGSGICGDVNALSSIRQGPIIWNLGPFSGAVLLVEEFGRGL